MENPSKSCKVLFGCLGITQMSSFNSPDQEEAEKCIPSPLVGRMGNSGQQQAAAEEVRRAGEHNND